MGLGCNYIPKLFDTESRCSDSEYSLTSVKLLIRKGGLPFCSKLLDLSLFILITSGLSKGFICMLSISDLVMGAPLEIILLCAPSFSMKVNFWSISFFGDSKI